MDVWKILALAAFCALSGCGGGSSMQSQPTPTVQQSKPISNVVAFMGDSITAYWAPYLPTPTDFSMIDLGVGGQTTVTMLARFQEQVIDTAVPVGVVVIEGGINDMAHDGLTIASTDSIKAMAAMAKAAGIRVIIASVMLEDHVNFPGDMPPSTFQIDSFNALLIKLCQEDGYTYADYRDVMLLPDGTEDNSLYIDGLHPNQAGYALMWKVVAPLIQEELQ